MITPIETILHQINNPATNRPLNILTTATHESYQNLLGYLPHKFYMLQGEGFKTWDYHTKPIPKNHYLLHGKFPNFFPRDIEFDLVLSQDKFGGFQRLSELAKRLNIPHLHIDHALPIISWNSEALKRHQDMRANKHLFVAEEGKRAWGGHPEDKVIYYGFDTNIFKGWHGSGKHGLSVVNHFASRDIFCGWTIWQDVAKEIPMQLVGENPGISESAKSTEHLAEMYANARFYLNTSQHSTFPMTVAEAMITGCPVISTAKKEIPNIIQHEVTGFLADTPKEMIAYAKLLLNDIELAKRIGENGQRAAIAKFSLERFLNEWNEAIVSCYEENR